MTAAKKPSELWVTLGQNGDVVGVCDQGPPFLRHGETVAHMVLSSSVKAARDAAYAHALKIISESPADSTASDLAMRIVAEAGVARVDFAPRAARGKLSHSPHGMYKCPACSSKKVRR